jgi:electron transport complex protein RnfG
MSSPEAEVMQQPSTPAGRMIRTLMGIAMLSGFLVVLTYQLTKPIIAENQRRAIEAAVFQVIPGAVERRDFIVNDQGVNPVNPEQSVAGTTIYAGYDANGQLLGIATNAAAQGYADLVHLLYGYDPACQCIRGIKVLKLAETPGLGDKIITDADFVANFDQLDVSLNADSSALANEIVTVKHGSKRNPWEIDAISGATISSKAVGNALNQSAQQVLPKVVPNLEKLQQGAGE